MKNIHVIATNILLIAWAKGQIKVATYKEVKTDKEFAWGDKSNTHTPIVTLADEYGGRAQIIEDDHCYVLLLKQDNGTYKETAWLFPEALKAIKKLPPPKYATK